MRKLPSSTKRGPVTIGGLCGLGVALALVVAGCQTMEHSVPYGEIRKIGVHTNQAAALVFRVDYLMSSFCGIGTYEFLERKDDNGRRFFLSLFRGKKSRTNITEDANRGVEITIPVEGFDPAKDSCWYLDSNGVHRIEVETPQSWDAYLRARDQVNQPPSSSPHAPPAR